MSSSAPPPISTRQWKLQSEQVWLRKWASLSPKFPVRDRVFDWEQQITSISHFPKLQLAEARLLAKEARIPGARFLHVVLTHRSEAHLGWSPTCAAACQSLPGSLSPSLGLGMPAGLTQAALCQLRLAPQSIACLLYTSDAADERK